MDGRFKTRLRRHTSLTGEKKKQYLYVGINLHDRPEGIITVKKYPQLTPQGAFRLEFKAQVREPTGRHTRLILWDSNYNMNPYQSREDFKKGLVVFLQRDKKNKSLPPTSLFRIRENTGLRSGELGQTGRTQGFHPHDGV